MNSIPNQPSKIQLSQNDTTYGPGHSQEQLTQSGLSVGRKRIFQSYLEQTPEQRAEKQKQARVERWKDQAEARRLLPKEAVAKCYHKPIPTKQEIRIHEYNQKNGNTRFYAGLQVCASVWTCPICAAKITERRRQEIEKAIIKASDLNLNVYLSTYTFRHHKKEPLKDNLQRFKKARHAVKSGRFAKDFKEKYQIVGTIEVLEATYGHYSHGWHPHTHELIFTREPLDLELFGQELRTKWEYEANRQGLTMNEHGFHITGTKGAIADYIAKFGREPKDPKHVWGPEAELTKGHLKKGRSEEDEHLTPFGILRAIRQGRTELEPVFVEYAAAFKGRHQLQWSPGLKKMLEVDEKTDGELAEEKKEDAPTILAMDKAKVWPFVTGNNYKAELLELPNAEEMRQALINLGADPNYIYILTLSLPATREKPEEEENPILQPEGNPATDPEICMQPEGNPATDPEICMQPEGNPATDPEICMQPEGNPATDPEICMQPEGNPATDPEICMQPEGNPATDPEICMQPEGNPATDPEICMQPEGNPATDPEICMQPEGNPATDPEICMQPEGNPATDPEICMQPEGNPATESKKAIKTVYKQLEIEEIIEYTAENEEASEMRD